jgi:hypothetical protein
MEDDRNNYKIATLESGGLAVEIDITGRHPVTCSFSYSASIFLMVSLRMVFMG